MCLWAVFNSGDLRSISASAPVQRLVLIQDIAAVTAPQSALFAQVKHVAQSLIVREYLHRARDESLAWAFMLLRCASSFFAAAEGSWVCIPFALHEWPRSFLPMKGQFFRLGNQYYESFDIPQRN